MSNLGWVCPVCNAGVAPSVTICPCSTANQVLPYDWPYGPKPVDAIASKPLRPTEGEERRFRSLTASPPRGLQGG